MTLSDRLKEVGLNKAKLAALLDLNLGTATKWKKRFGADYAPGYVWSYLKVVKENQELVKRIKSCEENWERMVGAMTGKKEGETTK